MNHSSEKRYSSCPLPSSLNMFAHDPPASERFSKVYSPANLASLDCLQQFGVRCSGDILRCFLNLLIRPVLLSCNFPNSLRESACKAGENYIQKPRMLSQNMIPYGLTARVLCVFAKYDTNGLWVIRLAPSNNTYIHLSRTGTIWLCVGFKAMSRSLSCTPKIKIVIDKSATILPFSPFVHGTAST